MAVTSSEVVAEAALMSVDARAALKAAGVPVVHHTPKAERCTKCRRKKIHGLEEDKNVCHCNA